MWSLRCSRIKQENEVKSRKTSTEKKEVEIMNKEGNRMKPEQ